MAMQLPGCLGHSVALRDCRFVYALHAFQVAAKVLSITLKGSDLMEVVEPSVAEEVISLAPADLERQA